MSPQQQPINEQEVNMADLERAMARMPGRPGPERPAGTHIGSVSRPQSICDTVHDFTEEVAEFLETAAEVQLRKAHEEVEHAQLRLKQAQEFNRQLCDYAHNVRLDGNGANKHQEKRG